MDDGGALRWAPWRRGQAIDSSVEVRAFQGHQRNVFVLLFFQAEDGIRDYKVTGVQTCALPILLDDSSICVRPWPRAQSSAADINKPPIPSERRSLSTTMSWSQHFGPNPSDWISA